MLRKIDTQAIGGIAAVFLFIAVMVALAIAFMSLGTLTVIGLIILGVGLFMLAMHRGNPKIGGMVAIAGFITFIVGYLLGA